MTTVISLTALMVTTVASKITIVDQESARSGLFREKGRGLTFPTAKWFTNMITGWINAYCTILPFSIIVNKGSVWPQNVIFMFFLLVNACLKLSHILLARYALIKALD